MAFNAYNTNMDADYGDVTFGFKSPTIGYNAGQIVAFSPHGVYASDFDALIAYTGGYAIVPAPASVGPCGVLPSNVRSILISSLIPTEENMFVIPMSEREVATMTGTTAAVPPHVLEKSLLEPNTSLQLGTSLEVPVSADDYLIDLNGVVVQELSNGGATLANAGGNRIVVETVGNQIVGSLYPNHEEDPSGRMVLIENRTSRLINAGVRGTRNTDAKQSLQKAKTSRFDSPKSKICQSTLNPGEILEARVPQQLFLVVACRLCTPGGNLNAANRQSRVDIGSASFVQTRAVVVKAGEYAVLCLSPRNGPVFKTGPLHATILVDVTMIATEGAYL